MVKVHYLVIDQRLQPMKAACTKCVDNLYSPYNGSKQKKKKKKVKKNSTES